jgi:hypothetical protein
VVVDVGVEPFVERQRQLGYNWQSQLRVYGIEAVAKGLAKWSHFRVL